MSCKPPSQRSKGCFCACKGPDAEELLLLALRGSEALEPLRQWLKLLLQSSHKLVSLQAMAVDQGETFGEQLPM